MFTAWSSTKCLDGRAMKVGTLLGRDGGHRERFGGSTSVAGRVVGKERNAADRGVREQENHLAFSTQGASRAHEEFG